MGNISHVLWVTGLPPVRLADLCLHELGAGHLPELLDSHLGTVLHVTNRVYFINHIFTWLQWPIAIIIHHLVLHIHIF